jgi:hypothetical protein
VTTEAINASATGLDLNDDASLPVGDAVLDLMPRVLGQDVSTCTRPCAPVQVLAKPVFNPHRGRILQGKKA